MVSARSSWTSGFLSIVVAFLAVLSLNLGIGADAAIARSCKDVMFIGARGSGEELEEEAKGTKGLGRPLYYMANRLRQKIVHYGESMGMLGVPYSADGVEELVPNRREVALMAASGSAGAAAMYYERHLKPYLASIDQGVRLTIESIEASLSGCPETELILAGYSQGAMAVRQAERKLEKTGKDQLLDVIGGTLLLGDGDQTPHSKAKRIGDAPADAKGVRVAFHASKGGDVVDPETTAEICMRNDIVCDFHLHLNPETWSLFGQGAFIHSAYIDLPQRKVLDQAVDWLAEEMGLNERFRWSDQMTSANVSAFRRCADTLGYTPKHGPWGLIIEDMHVQRISCDKAAQIGGAFYANDPMPRGWHCQFSFPWTSCRYRHTRRKFRFQFGGDAGRVLPRRRSCGQIGSSVGSGYGDIRAYGLSCAAARRVVRQALNHGTPRGWTFSYNGAAPDEWRKAGKRITGVPLGD